MSPSKRKHRSDSLDSMDSNRASIGSEDRTMDGPFDDQHLIMDQPIIMGVDPTIGSQASLGSNTMDLDGISEEVPPLPDRHPSELMQGVTQTELGSLSTERQEVNKAPEMQQRTAPSPFMSTSSASPERTKRAGSLEMEIPE